MAFMELNFYSEALGIQTQVNVILPQKSSAGEIGLSTSNVHTEQYKCLYLLHGLSDDHTIWMRRTSIERYASEYGICVVMPCGGRSFYCDIKNGMAYYTFIAKELPMRMQEFFRISGKREDTYIAGLSMGGYGAMKIALRDPDSYCACGALSPVCDLEAMAGIGYDSLMLSLFGDYKTPDEDNVMFLAEKQKDNPNKPKIFMAMGTDDFLYDNALPLRKRLTDNHYDFTYVEEEHANHNWAFWDAQIQNVLKWMFKKE
jgi:S-formylglutathione hydrolase FrmB